jgi:hypothetical protein
MTIGPWRRAKRYMSRCAWLQPVVSNLLRPRFMSDHKSKRGSDRTRIAINEEYEVRYWTKKLDVTEEELDEAVRAVGNRADKVEEYLKGK